MSSERQEHVEALARGLRVIEAFDHVDVEMTLSEVARKTSLKPATARRSLQTLANLGYVQTAKGRYFLSARILSLGSSYLRTSNVEGILAPTLRQLVGEFGDSAGVAVRIDANVLYVAHHFIPGHIRHFAGTGVSHPVHATSTGRVLLAHMPKAALDQWLRRSAPLTRHTELTETDPKRLRALFKTIRAQGYATVRDQLFYGVTALAVPIFNVSGEAVAALNTSAYTGLVTEAQLVRERLPHLKKAAAEISQMMMRHPTLLNSFTTEPGG